LNAQSVVTNSPFSVVSLFSGCGGSSLGYKMAGGKVHLAVEWDANAAACYRANFPDTPLYHGDIQQLMADEALRLSGIDPGRLDILDGSPPCQGFSTAGERDFEDPRNQLYKEYLRMLDVFRPKTFVMENVSGMVKGKMKLIFADILRELKLKGYTVSMRLLNASWYGVAEARERSIFIGVRSDLGIIPSHPRPLSGPINVATVIRGLGPQKIPLELSDKTLKLWRGTSPGDSFAQACIKLYGKEHHFNAKKLHPLRPSLTITKTVNKATGLYHWDEPRHMTIPELKRIHSFPDDFILIGKFEEQWARIGNSVPPLMMKAIAEHIDKEILQKVRP